MSRTTSRRFATLTGGPQEMVRYMMSGGLGTLLFYLLYEVLYWASLWPGHNATLSWFCAYITSILWTHRFHRGMTFRWDNPYWRSLRRTYVVYVFSWAATTGMMFVLVEQAGVEHHLAFCGTILASGCLNYLLLRNWSFRPPRDASS